MFHVLERAGFTDEYLNYVNYTMSTYVRMPYSNNWRAQTKKGRSIRHDCPQCTTPARYRTLGLAPRSSRKLVTGQRKSIRSEVKYR